MFNLVHVSYPIMPSTNINLQESQSWSWSCHQDEPKQCNECIDSGWVGQDQGYCNCLVTLHTKKN